MPRGGSLTRNVSDPGSNQGPVYYFHKISAIINSIIVFRNSFAVLIILLPKSKNISFMPPKSRGTKCNESRENRILWIHEIKNHNPQAGRL